MSASMRVWRVFSRCMHEASFGHLFHKSNSSFSPLRGKAVECTARPLQQDMFLVDSGLKTSIVCFQHELGREVAEKTKVTLEIESVESFGEPRMLLPKDFERKSTSTAVWKELEDTWRSDRNVVKGFYLNKVNGGYAVALAGYIAFVPRTLCRYKKIFPHNPWKMFNILNMNSKKGNIVVREALSRAEVWRPTSRTLLGDNKLKSRGAASPVLGPATPKLKEQSRLSVRRLQQSRKSSLR